MKAKRPAASFEALSREIVSCRRCPRLVEYRENTKPRKAFASQRYWRRPVPGFGDAKGRLLVVGLAPATRGGMRTGRIFTGDASSTFLVSVLHSAGFANQPTSESLDDGLVYADCYLTAAVKCAPPGDKPTVEESANCFPYREEERALLPKVKSVRALGSMAFRACLELMKRLGARADGMRFSHGAVYRLEGLPALYASYHPSPRNTNTGKLTRPLVLSVLERIRGDWAGGSGAAR